MSEIINNEDVRGEQVTETLKYFGDAVRGYCNTYALVYMNIKPEQFKLFSYDLEKGHVFQGDFYLQVLSFLITDFRNKVLFDSNWGNFELNRDCFMDYIDWFRINDDIYSVDFDRIRGLMREDFRHDTEHLINAYYILHMIYQSICTNDQTNYMNRLREANDESNRENLRIAIRCYDINKGKKSLFDEFILKTLKKYPNASNLNQGSTMGKDCILGYIASGRLENITRDDNLRERVSRELPREEIMKIIEASDVYDKNKSIEENIANYIDMVVIGEILSAFTTLNFSVANFVTYFNEYLRTGNLAHITQFNNGNKNLGALMQNMNISEVKRFYASLGISNTEEYIDKYFISREGPRKG